MRSSFCFGNVLICSIFLIATAHCTRACIYWHIGKVPCHGDLFLGPFFAGIFLRQKYFLLPFFVALAPAGDALVLFFFGVRDLVSLSIFTYPSLYILGEIFLSLCE